MKIRSTAHSAGTRRHGHSHAIHMPHPLHWLDEHPLIAALLITILLTLFVIGLAWLIQTGIGMDVFRNTRTPMMYRL